MNNSTVFLNSYNSVAGGLSSCANYVQDLTNSAIKQFKETDLSEYAKKADQCVDVALDKLNNYKEYVPYMAAGISGLYAGRAIVKLVNPQSKNVFLGNAIASAIVLSCTRYHESFQDDTGLSHIFLASTLASVMLFGIDLKGQTNVETKNHSIYETRKTYLI